MTLMRRIAVAAVVVVMLAMAFPRHAAALTFTISGTVTGSGGAPLANVTVWAYQGGAGATCCSGGNGAVTDASGAYSISIAPGTYRVRFYPNTTYVERWYNDAPDFASAADVVVSGNILGVNAALVAGHRIQGQVKNMLLAPLVGVGVHAYDATKPCCAWVTGASTDASGNYTLVVPNGSYRVWFYPGDTTHVAQWYHDASTFDAGIDVAVAGGDVMSIDAQLDDAYTISGTVSVAGGGPLANVFVGAFAATGICCTWVTGVETDATGAFVLPVTSGNYKLEFFPQSGNALGAWWDGAASFDTAAPITITNASVTGKNATLATGHTISGTVTAQSGGAPLGNVYVGVVRSTGLCCEWVAGTGTDSQGKYSVAVPDGSYRIQFYPGQGAYLQEYWNAASDFQSATTVAMAGANITGIDAHLASGLTITGTVTGSANGSPSVQVPVGQVFVGAYDAHQGCCTWVGGGGTDALGQYTITVPPGDYRLDFWPTSGPYLQQWFGGADFASAATIHVGANVSGKDVQLLSGHTIGGTVTAATGGAPLAQVWISVLKATGEWVGGGMTSSIGTYAIAVADGQYKLRFDPPSPYVSEWWDHQSDFSLAQTITVAGANVSGKNAQLATGHVISGTITDATGPVAGTGVQAYVAGAGCAAQAVAFGFSDSSGHYAVTVASGTYKLSFFESDHLGEWYDDKADCASASTIVVTGSDVPGKDAVLARGNLINGTVSGPSGPIAGAFVGAYQGSCSSLTFITGSSTDASGHYGVRVGSGSYLLFTSADGFAGEWYDDKGFDCASANAITVTGSDVTGKNVVLTPTHNVTGHVSDSSGPLAGVSVSAQTSASSCLSAVFVGGTATDASGNYTLALPDGSYKLAFFDPNLNHQFQYFDGKADCTSADPVVVSGADVGGKNAVLTRTYAVSGTVTAASGGAPIADATAAAFSSGLFVASATTDASGHYTLMVPSGTYTLVFSAAGKTTQWWNNQTDPAMANTFTVSNAPVSGKNAAMN